MNHLAILLLVLGANCLSGLAYAGQVTLVSDVEVCESEIPADRAAVVQAARSGDSVFLDIVSELNCAYVPDKPELREYRDSATVLLPTRSPSGAAAMCVCAHKMRFELKNLYEGVRTIYYVQDGTALGHASAP
jgi:hypothetical protein